jgi:hypothetical protein
MAGLIASEMKGRRMPKAGTRCDIEIIHTSNINGASIYIYTAPRWLI